MKPFCHGVEMLASYRYLGKNGKMWITYRCMFCGNKEEVEQEK